MSPGAATTREASVNTTWQAVMLLSLLSCFTTCMGVALALVVKKSSRAIAAGIGFSVGIMVLISVLELLPEAIAAIGASASLASASMGAALVWAAHLIVPHTHLVKESGMLDERLVRSAYLVVFGLVLHDVPEGVAMANAYIASPGLGLLVAIAIALHNLPEEFAMSVQGAVLKSKGFLFGAGLLSALAEPAGAILGLAAVSVAPALNAHLVAVAAGAMLFVSVHELVPMARRYRHAGLFLAGAGLSALVYALLAAAIPGELGRPLP
jgi:ZIP family zinc transporter